MCVRDETFLPFDRFLFSQKIHAVKVYYDGRCGNDSETVNMRVDVSMNQTSTRRVHIIIMYGVVRSSTCTHTVWRQKVQILIGTRGSGRIDEKKNWRAKFTRALKRIDVLWYHFRCGTSYNIIYRLDAPVLGWIVQKISHQNHRPLTRFTDRINTPR